MILNLRGVKSIVNLEGCQFDSKLKDVKLSFNIGALIDLKRRWERKIDLKFRRGCKIDLKHRGVKSTLNMGVPNLAQMYGRKIKLKLRGCRNDLKSRGSQIDLKLKDVRLSSNVGAPNLTLTYIRYSNFILNLGRGAN